MKRGLPRLLAFVYAMLIAYACLHPLTGWRDAGLPLFDFLDAPWPRYWRTEDLVANVAGYLPFGFLLAAAQPGRFPPRLRVVLAVLASFALSLSLETAQNFLESRVSSNVDLGCNTLGGLIGALLAHRLATVLFGQTGWLHRLRETSLVPGLHGDIGLTLIALWLMSQLTPDILLFGNGNLHTLQALLPLNFEARRFMWLESLLIALSLAGIGLYLRSLGTRPLPWLALALMGAGIGTKTLAGLSFFQPAQPWLWLTPGAQVGLLTGAPLLLAGLYLPAGTHRPLAALSLALAALTANLLPENPYLAYAPYVMKSGNFLTFHGLTGIVASAWPYLALLHLAWPLSHPPQPSPPEHR